MNATIQRFSGVALVASDIAASLHFWVDFAGAEVLAEGTPDGRLPWRLALGGVELELYAATDTRSPSPGSSNQHFCWDIEPTDLDWWLQKGLAWSMRPRTVSVHHNGLELGLYWDDPDGYHFEVAAHYCTDAELVKAHGERKERLRELMALPRARFTAETGPRARLTPVPVR